MNEEQIRFMFDDMDREEENVFELEESDENESDFLENNVHDSESEQSEGEYEPFVWGGPDYVGKDRITKWKMNAPPKNKRTKYCNIVTQRPGVKKSAQNAKTISDAWELFFPHDVIDQIVNYTNNQLVDIGQKYERQRDVIQTDRTEIRAMIGLLYLAGVNKSSKQNLEDLWRSDGHGIEYFRLTMSLRRFRLLLRALRFDDKNTRLVRQQSDRLAPIRDIFDSFVERSKSCYNINYHVTVDEMLESFRGRCMFRQYIPNKPAKYGIKIFALVDSQTDYTYNLEIYAGQQPNGPYKLSNSGFDVVDRLVTPISGTKRNITCDNWFSSIPLAKHLLYKHKLTMVGTLKKKTKKKYLPYLYKK